MSLTVGVYLGGQSYTVAEIRALRAAVLAWLDVNELTQDLALVESQVQSHMMAGHKASDI